MWLGMCASGQRSTKALARSYAAYQTLTHAMDTHAQATICVPHNIKPNQHIMLSFIQVAGAAARGCINGTGPGSSRREAQGHRPVVSPEVPKSARPAAVTSGLLQLGEGRGVGAGAGPRSTVLWHPPLSRPRRAARPPAQHHQPAAHFPQLLATFGPDTLSPMWRR